MANKPWYKRYPDHYLRGTRRLSLEARGAYSDCIDLMYSLDGRLPDDDSWMAHALVISVRKWRVVKAELTEAGKLSFVDGFIYNHRAEEELAKRADRMPTLSQPVAEVEIASATERQSHENDEKHSNFNKADRKSEAIFRSLDSEAEAEERKIDHSQPAIVESDAARGAATTGLLAGLSDLSSDLICDLARVVNPIDPAGAVPQTRTWLQSLRAGGYSREEIGDAHAVLATRIAEGRKIDNPMAFLTGALRTGRKPRDSDAPWVTKAKARQAETQALLASMMQPEALQ